MDYMEHICPSLDQCLSALTDYVIFSTGISGSGPQKTALIQLALPTSVYLLHVYSLKKLPAFFQNILLSQQIVKLGQIFLNLHGTFQKLHFQQSKRRYIKEPLSWDGWPSKKMLCQMEKHHL